MASGHQITITPTGQHVEVALGGEKLASSGRALLLQETGSPAEHSHVVAAPAQFRGDQAA